MTTGRHIKVRLVPIFLIFVLTVISMLIKRFIWQHTERELVDHFTTKITETTKIKWIRNWTLGYHAWCVQHQRNNLSFTLYADKHLAKKYVQKLVPTLKVAKEYAYVSSAGDINETLIQSIPKEYIFKANHLSGGVAIVEGNTIKCVGPPCPSRNSMSNLKYLQHLCSTWLKVNYAKLKPPGELYYRDIEPKCMFEEFLGNSSVLSDYKIFVFNGKPYFIETDVSRFINHKRDFYTPGWNRIPLTKIPKHLAHEKPLPEKKPLFLEDMLFYAEVLSQPFRMMRVDFFGFEDKFAFAEFSPSHDNCKGRFEPLCTEIFYGYVAEHPSVYVNPEAVLQLFSGYTCSDKKNKHFN